jgi:hypothetical protein
MTIDWRHRIVRVGAGDLDRQRDVVLDGLMRGWILDAQVPGIEQTVDLVFRRATPVRSRDSWA